jgi:hypothetical protein
MVVGSSGVPEGSLSVPEDEPLVLHNEDQWWDERVRAGQAGDSFPEPDGRYWGPPPDDPTAIRELERLRQAGAGFVAVAWSTMPIFAGTCEGGFVAS